MIPLTEKEFLAKQMAENPVLEETLKHSSDIHILEEIEAFYNEHIEAEKAVVDVLVAGGAKETLANNLREVSSKVCPAKGGEVGLVLRAQHTHTHTYNPPASQSNAHYIGARKYKTLAHELTFLADKNPEEYAAFREKIQAMGNHHAQPNAPFAARVVLGNHLFDSLIEVSDQLSYDEM